MDSGHDEPPRDAEPASPPAPPVGDLARLWRAVDGAVVFVGPDDQIQFVSPNTAKLHGQVPFDSWWGWIAERLHGALDTCEPADDDEIELALELPEALGGRRLQVRMLAIDAARCAGYLAILKDQHRLDSLHADLRLAGQMRRTQATLRQAAHDLKAPLQAMTLNVDVLRRELREEGLPGATIGRLDLLDRELRRLGRMVQMLLTQSPSQNASKRRFDLRRLVREKATLVRALARESSVVVEVRMPREQLTVFAVRDHLKQALFNLVNNALEAMPDGGRLTFELSRSGDDARLAIIDTGCGIDEALHEDLFKLHVTTKSTGTGIGLFSARATVQQAGGQLSLESDGRSGTTALVVLPLAIDEVPDMTEPPAAPGTPPENGTCSTS